jgi:hypothetical protein
MILPPLEPHDILVRMILPHPFPLPLGEGNGRPTACEMNDGISSWADARPFEDESDYTLEIVTAPALGKKEQTPLAIFRYQPADSRRMFRCLWAHLLRSP